ncbi:MAG: hypothetical protein ACTS5I_04745 [Rhodanobacter sp.]
MRRTLWAWFRVESRTGGDVPIAIQHLDTRARKTVEPLRAYHRPAMPKPFMTLLKSPANQAPAPTRRMARLRQQLEISPRTPSSNRSNLLRSQEILVKPDLTNC